MCAYQEVRRNVNYLEMMPRENQTFAIYFATDQKEQSFWIALKHFFNK